MVNIYSLVLFFYATNMTTLTSLIEVDWEQAPRRHIVCRGKESNDKSNPIRAIPDQSSPIQPIATHLSLQISHSRSGFCRGDRNEGQVLLQAYIGLHQNAEVSNQRLQRTEEGGRPEGRKRGREGGREKNIDREGRRGRGEKGVAFNSSSQIHRCINPID